MSDPHDLQRFVDAQAQTYDQALAVPDEPVFRQVLDHYFGGAEDEGTTSRL